jgi:hypothetical protein
MLFSPFLSDFVVFFVVYLLLAIFLEVEIRLSSERYGDNGKKPVTRSLSFGSLSQSLSIKDFHLIKVLGRGRYIIFLPFYVLLIHCLPGFLLSLPALV